MTHDATESVSTDPRAEKFKRRNEQMASKRKPYILVIRGDDIGISSTAERSSPQKPGSFTIENAHEKINDVAGSS